MHEQVVQRLGLDAIAYVAPAAADNTWYPKGFMAAIEENEPRLTFALERLSALSDDLAGRGYPYSAQVVLGFSQGSCLGSEFVYRRRRRYGALIGFTGGLVGAAGTRWDAETDAFRGMPVFLGGSDVDPWVPVSRILETAEVFRRLQATVSCRIYPSMGHEICDDEIGHAREILAALR